MKDVYRTIVAFSLLLIVGFGCSKKEEAQENANPVDRLFLSYFEAHTTGDLEKQAELLAYPHTSRTTMPGGKMHSQEWDTERAMLRHLKDMQKSYGQITWQEWELDIVDTRTEGDTVYVQAVLDVVIQMGEMKLNRRFFNEYTLVKDGEGLKIKDTFTKSFEDKKS